MISVPQSYGGASYTTAYAYNNLDRLNQETNTPATYPALGTLSYDGAGNRGGASYNVDNQSAANTYDGEGNPTGYGGRPLAFDALDQMTSFGSLLSAGYDASGLRAWKQSAQTGGKVYTFYDGSSRWPRRRARRPARRWWPSTRSPAVCCPARRGARGRRARRSTRSTRAATWPSG
jgi:hypothetical protein